MSRIGRAAEILRALPLTVAPLEQAVALAAGGLFLTTRSRGLSLEDRVCLALAGHRNQPALTADRSWTDLAPVLGVTIRLIR